MQHYEALEKRKLIGNWSKSNKASQKMKKYQNRALYRSEVFIVQSENFKNFCLLLYVQVKMRDFYVSTQRIFRATFKTQRQ
jgi:hypothetical protein